MCRVHTTAFTPQRRRDLLQAAAKEHVSRSHHSVHSTAFTPQRHRHLLQAAATGQTYDNGIHTKAFTPRRSYRGAARTFSRPLQQDRHTTTAFTPRRSHHGVHTAAPSEPSPGCCNRTDAACTPRRSHRRVHTAAFTSQLSHHSVHTTTFTPQRSHPSVHITALPPQLSHHSVHTAAFTPPRVPPPCVPPLGVVEAEVVLHQHGERAQGGQDGRVAVVALVDVLQQRRAQQLQLGAARQTVSQLQHEHTDVTPTPPTTFGYEGPRILCRREPLRDFHKNCFNKHECV